jgi:fluoride ion exporter CrcB/FEX
VRVLVAVVGVVVGWALFLAKLFGSFMWGMLFAMVVQGKCWWVRLCVFGLCGGVDVWLIIWRRVCVTPLLFLAGR